MKPMDRCLASMARLSITQVSRPSLTSIPRFLAPSIVQQTRQASDKRPKKSKAPKPTLSKDYNRPDLDQLEFPRWTLCEAMRILRASEVGQPPASIKYELHINLKTPRNGPVIKGSIRLPNAVQSEWQVAVICPEDSDIAIAAAAAGAVAVGEETIFEAVRAEKIGFDRLICHEKSEQALNKAGLGKILGPKGLMPNRRMKTIVDDVGKAIRDLAGAAEYRERQGVIRLAVGQLGYTPDQLKANISGLLKKIKSECADLQDEVTKEIHEVILSTTNGPALSLNARFHDPESETKPEALAGAM
ncbi:hypothetical protein E4U17_004340 [Claviceps sp. LM77 group G4]|nr:hypothetical protein E4U17_004340 [Claviceps sp. LM77 group G4]KAG6065717.1 hypothetical protein E4U33_005773 [Claviceps sp. LM78 group G4]KAG6074124.1 hypothetical protein E4U16_004216 [Claviceps sp. LM84 group G4]